MTIWEIPAGTRKTYRAKLTSGGAPTDLTGCTVHFTAKERFTQSDDEAFLNLEISDFGDDPTLGEVEIPIDFSASGDSQFEEGRIYHANFVVIDSQDETTHSKNFQIRIIPGPTKEIA